MTDGSEELQKQQHSLEKAACYVQALSARLGRPARFHVSTFGCQMNARDSEKLRGVLLKAGYEETENEEDADLILYNTCTVRENADKHVYGRLGYLQGLKKKNPELRIGLCGCMMQEPQIVAKIKKSYPFVSLIFGTHNLFTFPELLCRMFEEDRKVVDVWEKADGIVEDLPVERSYPFKSGVNIMYGCDNFCSYCIVPYVRGRERSRRPEDILAEVQKLACDGVLEIMLLGQNVNSYGKGLAEETDFASLLSEVCRIDGIRRVRFMTSHPKDLSDRLLAVMAENEKICRHIHLPVQSGSTKILQKMNRRYTRESYLSLTEKIRKILPDVSLTTDIIVGFPGETEEDFQDTLSLVEQCGYDSVFTFEYSKRTGTPAAVMEEQVPPAVVKERFARLLKVVGETGEKACRRFEGTVQDVLVEEKNREEGLVTGRIGSNLVVHFPGGEDLIGKIVPVRLTSCRGFYYIGNREE